MIRLPSLAAPALVAAALLSAMPAPASAQDADAAEQVMRDHLLAQLAALRELSLTEEPVHG